MEPQQILTAAVFCLVYLWLILGKRYLAAALWVGVAALLALPPLLGLPQVLSLLDPVRIGENGSWASINWNVIGIFAGTLLAAEVFIYSRVPSLLADLLVDRCPNVGWAILGVCIFSSFISTFAANVATLLIVAPIAIELAKRLKVSPAPFLIGIAISSNLQGTATLIGDPPSMILAAHYKMNFNDFFWYGGRPGIFFAVQAGAVASFVVLWLLFRKYREPVVQIPVQKPRSWFPTLMLVLMVVALSLASFVDENFLWFGGAVCVAAGVVSVAWLYKQDRQSALSVLKSYDWSTTFFLMGVFMLVFALQNVGIITLAANWAYSITGTNLLAAFVLVVFVSMVLSAFVDNIPYIVAMLPLVHTLGQNMNVGQNMVLAYGLLIGACLGGNITPIGASTNVVAYGTLRKMGEKTSFLGFVKIGLPFTLVATAAASAFVWFVWR